MSAATAENEPGSWRWDDKDIEAVPEDIRPLLEDYAGVPSEDVVSHILNIVRHLRPLLPLFHLLTQ